MPDDPKNSDSLGNDRTFTGEPDVPQEEQRSLGDQATAGDALSSISDLEFDGQVPDSDLPLIDLVARYEIEGELGKGGMGAVQLATDRQLKRQVAIKRIHASSQSALNRFVTEAQSIASLNHFNIVQVYDFGRDADGPLLVMEYVSGGSLLDRLKDSKLEVEEAVSITCQVCDALAVAHEQGIIHRDIKPANILLTTRGEPKLTDFGLARQDSVDHGQTQAGAVLGTIDFMPPEQRRDATATDARSDLWSLAATLYQMITGSSPKVIRLDQVPANLAPVIGKMLEENPDQRYATAAEFKTELRTGMAAAAAPVAVDVAAGVCPACNTPNDASRKFCQKCAGSLIAPCLSCNEEIAVWDNVCGQCGSKQDQLRDLLRNELAASIEESLTLAHRYEYENALVVLSTVQGDPHAFNEDLREQAIEQSELVTAQRDEQYKERNEFILLANAQLKQYNYVAAAKELEKIPRPLWTNATQEQFNETVSARDELASLLQEISNDIKNERTDGLLEKIARVLELNPAHEKVQTLREQLLEREAKWATDRLNERLLELKTQITAETDADAKVLHVEAFLQLRPEDESAKSLLETLHQEIFEKAQQQRQAEKKKEVIKTGSIVAGGVLLLLTVVWIGFSYKAKKDAEAARIVVLEREAADQALADRLAYEVARDEAVLKKAAAEKAERGKKAISNALAQGDWQTVLELDPDNMEATNMKAAAEKAAAIRSALEQGDWKTVLVLDPGNTLATKMKVAEERLATAKERLAKVAAIERSAHTLSGHSGPVASVAFSPDGKRIASGSRDQTVKIWDVATSETVTRRHFVSIYSVAFSPNGKTLVSGSKGSQVWNVEGPGFHELKERMPTLVMGVAFSPDGKRIAGGCLDNMIKVWDAEDGRELGQLEGHTDHVQSVAFSPDGRRLVSGSDDTTLKVWDTGTGKEAFTLRGHTHNVNSVAFSPDSRRIVSGSSDMTLKVWLAGKYAAGQTLTLKGHTSYVRSVAFSPDGKRIASGSWDKTVKIWDADTGQEEFTLKGNSDYIQSVAFSPDGRRLVSGNDDNTVKIYDISPLTAGEEK